MEIIMLAGSTMPIVRYPAMLVAKSIDLSRQVTMKRVKQKLTPSWIMDYQHTKEQLESLYPV